MVSGNPRVNAPGLARLPQFAHATRAGELLFVSGTLGTIDDGFELVSGGAGPETRQTLANISSILEAADLGVDDIVKVSVFMSDMAGFPEMNAAYTEFFGDDPPARITVGGVELALGATVEIECIAHGPGSPPPAE
jgi:2-iminobutanoate/2-iminopropanoate deaminase